MSKARQGAKREDLSIVLCGQAGQGVQTVEFLLTRILKRAGYHVFHPQLEPLGVQVVHSETALYDLLPFEDGSFDLAINRHSGLNIAEVERVLAPGGTSLTPTCLIRRPRPMWATSSRDTQVPPGASRPSSGGSAVCGPHAT
mgnify:CR=1 FL=1